MRQLFKNLRPGGIECATVTWPNSCQYTLGLKYTTCRSLIQIWCASPRLTSQHWLGGFHPFILALQYKRIHTYAHTPRAARLLFPQSEQMQQMGCVNVYTLHYPQFPIFRLYGMDKDFIPRLNNYFQSTRHTVF